MFKTVRDWINKHLDWIVHGLTEFFIVMWVTLFLNLWFGLGVGVFLGILKEFVDEVTYDGWDWHDLIADAVGILLATVYVWIA